MSAAALDNMVECRLCPKRCKLAPNQRGDCRVRVNRDGELITLVYGKPCAMHIDPVEKKPMFHFLPGTPILSLATAGCNLHCKFCQNWRISQSDPEDVRNSDASPEALVKIATERDCRSIAYTYSDPVIYFEYAMDSAQAARDAGLKTVIVSAGYIEPEPLKEMCALTDAANIDLKAFSDRFYREWCDATLAPVLNTLETMAARGVLVEVTNLIIPTLNDDMGMIAEMCDWIKTRMGAETPLHFSRFQPMYRVTDLPPTPPDTLIKAAELAQAAGLKHVYVGNIRDGRFENTYCPACRKPLIARAGYRILENHVNDGRCSFCGAAIHGIWR